MAARKKCTCKTVLVAGSPELITCLRHTEIRLAICEQDAVILKPHVSYRFYVDQTCDKCMAYESRVVY